MRPTHGAIALLALPLAFAATAAEGQARPDTRNMTCAQANQLVQQRGQVVMNTGPRTYRRFVANRGFCDRDAFTRVEFVPTLDNPQCPVEWVCFRRPRGNR